MFTKESSFFNKVPEKKQNKPKQLSLGKSNLLGKSPLNQLQPSAAIVWELPLEQQENLSQEVQLLCPRELVIYSQLLWKQNL